MTELAGHERIALDRLFEDVALMQVLKKLDEDRAETLARELIAETQAVNPDTPRMIQLGSQIKERLRGAQLYLDAAKELRQTMER